MFSIFSLPELARRRLSRLSEAPPDRGFFPEYADDPVGFARDKLKVKLWRRQEELLVAIAKNPSVAVRSGHKVGKSTALVVAALWFLCTRARARVILTAPTERQVKMILWRELRRVGKPLFGVLGAEPALDPATGLQVPDGRECVGFTARDAERMAGFSGDEVLFLCDEASGIPEAIFEALEGNRAGGARMVMSSNPTQTSGTFFDAFHGQRRFWYTLHISSAETPNATGVGEPVPGLATRSWVAEKREQWGEDSPLYRVRVLGEFPNKGDNTVIGLGLVESALERWPYTEEKGRLCIGVDVARFGDDDSAIYGVRGKKALPPLVVHGLDIVEVAGKVLEYARAHREPNEVPRVNVDNIGIGAGVEDILRQSDEVEVCGINGSCSADNDTEFYNLRTEVWFALATWLQDGALCENSTTEGDLVTPKYSFDLKGRRKLESKDEIKKRLKRSPDHGDALALAAYRGRVGGEERPPPPHDEYRFANQRGY